MIDWDKPIETVHEGGARLLGKIHIRDGVEGFAVAYKYTRGFSNEGVIVVDANGSSYRTSEDCMKGEKFIRNVPQKRELWINVYNHGHYHTIRGPYASAREASEKIVDENVMRDDGEFAGTFRLKTE